MDESSERAAVSWAAGLDFDGAKSGLGRIPRMSPWFPSTTLLPPVKTNKLLPKAQTLLENKGLPFLKAGTHILCFHAHK